MQPVRSWESGVAARPTPGTARRNLQSRLLQSTAVCCSAGWAQPVPQQPLRLSFTSLFVSSWDWDCFVDFTAFYNILHGIQIWDQSGRQVLHHSSALRSSLMVNISLCLRVSPLLLHHVVLDSQILKHFQHIFHPINHSSDWLSISRYFIFGFHNCSIRYI